MPKTIAEMTDEVCEWAKRKGWWNDGRTFGDMVALATSELSEALEEFRTDHMEVYYKCKDCGFEAKSPLEHYVGLNTRVECLGEFKPEGASVEFADLLIRMLHTAAHYGWNLEELYEIKMTYNEKRPFRHGDLKL